MGVATPDCSKDTSSLLTASDFSFQVAATVTKIKIIKAKGYIKYFASTGLL